MPSASQSWPGSHFHAWMPRSLASRRISRNAEVMSPSLGSAVYHRPERDDASKQAGAMEPLHAGRVRRAHAVVAPEADVVLRVPAPGDAPLDRARRHVHAQLGRVREQAPVVPIQAIRRAEREIRHEAARHADVPEQRERRRLTDALIGHELARGRAAEVDRAVDVGLKAVVAVAEAEDADSRRSR